MDKLTLEHIAPYLPYGLKAETPNRLVQIKGIDTCGTAACVMYWVNGLSHSSFILDIKPILRPLSDLITEMEHKGEKFVPIIELFKLRTQVTGDEIFDYYIENDTAVLRLKGQQLEPFTFISFFEVDIEPNQVMFSIASEKWVDDKMTEESLSPCGNEMKMFQKLLEWHFDVFGLIEKDLAVDINTLKEVSND